MLSDFRNHTRICAPSPPNPPSSHLSNILQYELTCSVMCPTELACIMEGHHYFGLNLSLLNSQKLCGCQIAWLGCLLKAAWSCLVTYYCGWSSLHKDKKGLLIVVQIHVVHPSFFYVIITLLTLLVLSFVSSDKLQAMPNFHTQQI